MNLFCPPLNWVLFHYLFVDYFDADKYLTEDDDFDPPMHGPSRISPLSVAAESNKTEPTRMMVSATAVRSSSSRRSDPVPLKCVKCNEEFDTQHEHQQHVNDCETYSCRKCDYVKSNYRKLESHVRKVHFSHIYQCGGCQYVVYDESDEVAHRSLSCPMDGCYQCRSCNYFYPHFAAWQDHDEIHLPAGDYKCSYCSFVTDKKNEMIGHVDGHLKYLPYRCCYCAWGSTKLKPMTLHLGKCHGGKSHVMSFHSHHNVM